MYVLSRNGSHCNLIACFYHTCIGSAYFRFITSRLLSQQCRAPGRRYVSGGSFGVRRSVICDVRRPNRAREAAHRAGTGYAGAQIEHTQSAMICRNLTRFPVVFQINGKLDSKAL